MIILFFFILLTVVQIIVTSLVFPLPVSDMRSVRYRSLPWATMALILLNTLVYILWIAPNDVGMLMADTDEQFLMELDAYTTTVWTYGFRVTTLREGVSIGAFITFTSMFMHADFLHLFFNMIYLWAFGRRVEDACGPWRFLLFYLVAGMVANMGGAILNPSDIDLPGIGASGAISGVMGAYLLLFPGARIACVWGIGLGLRIIVKIFGNLAGGDVMTWRWTTDFPAIIILIFYAVQNAIPSFEIIQSGDDFGGVNYLAHLTGFLAAILIFLFVRKDLMMRYVAGRRL